MTLIDSADLVGIKEIADRLGWSTSAVQNWTTRHESFPMPVVTLAAGRFYCWPEVEAWARRTNRVVPAWQR